MDSRLVCSVLKNRSVMKKDKASLMFCTLCVFTLAALCISLTLITRFKELKEKKKNQNRPLWGNWGNLNCFLCNLIILLLFYKELFKGFKNKATEFSNCQLLYSQSQNVGKVIRLCYTDIQWTETVTHGGF